MSSPVKRELIKLRSGSKSEYTPFGNTRVRNVFKDFCFVGNISDVDEVTKVFARNYC
jgi:hypothetical protein